MNVEDSHAERPKLQPVCNDVVCKEGEYLCSQFLRCAVRPGQSLNLLLPALPPS